MRGKAVLIQTNFLPLGCHPSSLAPRVGKCASAHFDVKHLRKDSSKRRLTWQAMALSLELLARIGLSRLKSPYKNCCTKPSPAADVADSKSKTFCTVHGSAIPCTSSSRISQSAP